MNGNFAWDFPIASDASCLEGLVGIIKEGLTLRSYVLSRLAGSHGFLTCLSKFLRYAAPALPGALWAIRRMGTAWPSGCTIIELYKNL